MLGSVDAFSQAAHAANTYRTRFQVRARRFYVGNTSSPMVDIQREREAHTHRELIREWLWKPKGSSLEYI